MSVPGKMLHVGMGPSPLREPLDRPRPRPVPPRPETPARPRPARRRAPARATRRRTAFVLFASVVSGALIVLLASAQALVAESSFRTEELHSRIEDLEREHGRLRLRSAELLAPGRLQGEARAQGLVYPTEIHLIRVPREGVSMPGSGAGKAPAQDAPADTGALGGGR